MIYPVFFLKLFYIKYYMDNYVQDALMSLKSESNPILSSFFSDANIEYIQKELNKQVKIQTRKIIGKQSCLDIYIIMKYIYVNNVKIYMSHCDKEIERLNDLVLTELVPMVCSNILQYFQYIRDSTSLPVPIAHSKPTSVKGDNSLEFKLF